MAKNAKKPPAHNGKPITAFFVRAHASPSNSQDASRSQATKQSPKNASARLETEDVGKVLPIVECSSANRLSESPTKQSMISDPLSVSGSSPRSERKHTSLMPPAASSLKRLRSPSLLEVPETPATLTSNKSPERQNGEFNSGLEMESTIHVNSTPNSKSQKRARLSAAEDSAVTNFSDLIPSSQSDEEELTIKKAPATPRKLVADARQNTSWPLTPDNDIPDSSSMEVDRDVADNSKQFMSSMSPSDGTMATRPGSQATDNIMTPPPSDLPSMPPTPIALDTASKTAKIIADIKARAYEAASSPEPAIREIDELDEDLDSSSDEDDFPPILPQPKVNISSPSNNTNAGSSTTRRSTRISLKNQSPSPTDRSRARAPSGRVRTKTSAATKGKLPVKMTFDPFAPLLKEKLLAEKRGNGNDAFTQAEIRTRNLGKSGLLVEMDEDDDSGSDEQNGEDIARQLIENPDAFVDEFKNIAFLDKSKMKEMTGDLEDGVAKTLFGSRDNWVVLDILKQDKASKRHDESAKKTSGIQFWSLSSSASTSSHSTKDVSSLRLLGSSALIRLFNNCIQRNDLVRAAILLHTNFMSSLDVCDRASAATYLYDLAFSFPLAPDFLREAAANALGEFWSSNEEPCTSSISFSRILATAEALGAHTSIIFEQDWTILDVGQIEAVDSGSRELVLSLLLTLLTACARSKRLQIGEISHIVTILLLMGMDISASSNHSRDIALAIDLICHCLPQEGSRISEIELELCSRVLKCAKTYKPVNKNRLVSLLSGGSGITRRIANFVAYCIITDRVTPEPTLYSDAPALPGIIEQLKPYSRSSPLPPGKFALHENTDYVDLAFYITILGVAVSSLRKYVDQEKQVSAARNYAASIGGSLRKVADKPKTDLQLVHAALETLHSNISDTRATHLERSRTKAVIKGLSMNIHYQREHWSKNGNDVRSKLTGYFSIKPKA